MPPRARGPQWGLDIMRDFGTFGSPALTPVLEARPRGLGSGERPMRSVNRGGWLSRRARIWAIRSSCRAQAPSRESLVREIVRRSWRREALVRVVELTIGSGSTSRPCRRQYHEPSGSNHGGLNRLPDHIPAICQAEVAV
jgi:hypothetical protein